MCGSISDWERALALLPAKFSRAPALPARVAACLRGLPVAARFFWHWQSTAKRKVGEAGFPAAGRKLRVRSTKRYSQCNAAGTPA